MVSTVYGFSPHEATCTVRVYLYSPCGAGEGISANPDVMSVTGYAISYLPDIPEFPDASARILAGAHQKVSRQIRVAFTREIRFRCLLAREPECY